MPTQCFSSGYSPLFTWGLLQASPETVTHHVDGDASAYYFTLRTGKRDTVELRSFLYLDLASSSTRSIAAQTQRSRQQASHRRKNSVLSRSTSWTFCTSEVNSDLQHEKHIAFTPKRVLPLSSKLAVPSVSRQPSRESLRNIPSPKPAPSTSLPDPPVASLSAVVTVKPNNLSSAKSQSPPSLRPLPSPMQGGTRTVPPSPSHPRSVQPKRWDSRPHLSLAPSTSSYTSSFNVLLSTPPLPQCSHRRASHSVPLVEHDSSLLSPPPFSPCSPAFSGGGMDSHKFHHQRRASSPARSESITSSARIRSRMDALACLEGRGRSSSRKHGRRKSSFISMSDGEDGEGDGEEKRPNIMVCREGEETRLAPTICVEDVGSMGDIEDEGGEEEQCVSNSRLFVSNQVQSRPDDDRYTPKRLVLSPARSAPIFLSGSKLASASAGSSSFPATSPVTSAVSSSTSNVSGPPAVTDITEASTSRGRKRRSTIESWFPLRSFIDLKADSDERVVSSWKWRSFIEIGVASL
ncbi:hypothetical protein F5141DRAFT_1290667 [Pisolithus sp. B1]|nr:hypothetical protein F5141DRAFT_1290667 [Pisolithus sp. B1]